MNDYEDLENRLNTLGRQPVEPALASRHLTAMTNVLPRRNLMQRLRIVGAFAVGVLVGTTGLASAGALPGGMQEVAHDTLGAVGVDVPRGERYQGAECGGEVKNHGQYVKSQPKEKRAEAAASRCGKPIQAGDDGAEKAKADKADGGCRPAWAGRGKPTQAEKDAHKACVSKGDKAGGTVAEDPAAASRTPESPPAEETTTTTAAATTTPTSAATTTTTSAATTTSTSAATTTTANTPPGGTDDAPAVPELPVPDPGS